MFEEEGEPLTGNKKTITPKKAIRWESVCQIIQLLILALLVYVLVQFALLEKPKVKFAEDIVEDELSMPSLEEKGILDMLKSDEGEQLNFLFADESNDELAVEANPWTDGVEQGWIFKNGLTLAVRQTDDPIAKITLEIQHGYQPELLEGTYLESILMQLSKVQCSPDVDISIASFRSGITVKTETNIEGCLTQLTESLNTRLTDAQFEIVDTDSNLTVEMITDSKISDSSIVQQKFDSLLKSNTIKLLVVSDLTQNEVYLFVSDLKLATQKTSYVPTTNVEETPYNQIKREVKDITLPTEAKIDTCTVYQVLPDYQYGLYRFLSLQGDKTLFEFPDSVPQKISQDLWFKKSDDNFIGVLIHARGDPLQIKIAMKVAQRYFESEFKHMTFESNQRGLIVTCQNISQLQSLKVTEEKVFTKVKNLLVEDFRKFYSSKLEFFAINYVLPKLMLRPVHHPSEIVTGLESLTWPQFQDFMSSMLKEMQYTAYISGSKIPEMPGVAYQEEVYTLTLGIDQIMTHSESIKFAQPGLLAYFTTGPRTIKNMAALILLQELYSKDKTFQVKFKSIGCVDGLLFFAQGKEPLELQVELEELLLQEKSKPNVTLHYQHTNEYIWDRILNGNFDFNEIEELRKEIEIIDDLDILNKGLYIYLTNQTVEDTYIVNNVYNCSFNY